MNLPDRFEYKALALLPQYQLSLQDRAFISLITFIPFDPIFAFDTRF
jgi:hypothetical protein